MTEITLLVYSGRTNPVWNLSDEQEREFTRLLHGVTLQASADELQGGLGYRGFAVRMTAPVGDVPLHFRVFRSVLESDQAAGHKPRFRDDHRTIESWLAGTIPNSVSDGARALVAQSLRGQ